MTTRVDLRGRVRDELNDAGGTPLWSDASLNRWLAEAIRTWSIDCPAQRVTTLVSVADQPNYGLPGDLLGVRRVEHPTSIFRAPVPFAAGDRAGVLPELVDAERGLVAPGTPTYDVYSGLLWLDPAPDAAGESIIVRYDALYTVPSLDATVLDLPAQDEDPVVWYACARALRWIAVDEAKRQRFERQRGSDPWDIQRGYDQMVSGAVRDRRRRVGPRRLVVRGEG